MNAFFQTARGKAAGMRRIDSDDEMDDIDVISFSPPPQGKENTPPDLVADVGSVPIEPTVNQSVILIEEVDVLYQTDTNFWPALINIIKDCRRPVILTCNGGYDLFAMATIYLTAYPYRCITRALSGSAIADDTAFRTLPRAVGRLVLAGIVLGTWARSPAGGSSQTV